MRQTIALVLVTTMLLAGCATTARAPYPATLDARGAAFAKAVSCCTDPSGLNYVQLPSAGTLDVVIGRSSPAFDFQSGLSPYAAFRLPDGDKPFRVQVKSYFEGPEPQGSIFYPVLAMMDDLFIVTRISNLNNLQLDQGLTLPGDAPGLAVTAPFDPNLSKERYLVVFTPAALLGSPPAVHRDGDVLTAPSLVWLQHQAGAAVPASPYGHLRIIVAPESLPGPG